VILLTASARNYYLVTISQDIEKTRRRMERLGDEYGLLDPKVLSCSEELDLLVIKYYKADYEVNKRQSKVLVGV
jgi:hypothetical protein